MILKTIRHGNEASSMHYDRNLDRAVEVALVRHPSIEDVMAEEQVI